MLKYRVIANTTGREVELAKSIQEEKYKKIVYCPDCFSLLLFKNSVNDLFFVSVCYNTSAFSELEEFKGKVQRQKKEEKKKRQVMFSNPPSKQASVKSSARSEAGSVNGAYLFDITSTGIERSASFQNDLDVSGKTDVVVKVDVNSKDNIDGDLTIPQKNRLDNPDNISITSEISREGSAVLLLPGGNNAKGRPRSWAGTASEPHENLNEIYRDLYQNGGDTDVRGYVKSNHLNPHQTKPDQRRHSDLKYGDMRQYNKYSDSRGKPRSMTDLRVAALQGGSNNKKALSVEDIPVRKTISVENIHTGQITKLTARPRSPNNGQKKKKMGIYARQQEEMLESPF